MKTLGWLYILTVLSTIIIFFSFVKTVSQPINRLSKGIWPAGTQNKRLPIEITGWRFLGIWN